MRKRPTIPDSIVPKQKINGLADEEVEVGEQLQKTIKDITCEHNLPNLLPVHGNVLLTNYKLVFKPSDFQLDTFVQATY